MALRMILDGISALRYLLGGSLKNFWAVARAHLSYYGMKNAYRGTNYENKFTDNSVIVSGIYPGSIVAGFFLKGRKKFEALKWDSARPDITS